ncbi:NTP transferase domain-containing protein [Candidatus Roizmanbacteria bacterium]|nr:NTP transferase domain-containing protein [Candidatus Roizmanbacteria bacterium]
MPVVIFCGGTGTRMKEETEFRPKPMVNVGGHPILWHIMKIYEHYGFNEFIIALGYKGDYIKNYFINQEYLLHDITVDTKTGKSKIFRTSKRKHDNLKITFVDTGLETLTGERLLRVKKYIKTDRFMVTYGDGVSNIALDKLVEYHNQKDVTGLVTGVHPKSKWGLVVADENNIVQRFKQKPVLDEFVNGGFMVFKSGFFKYLRKRETIEQALDRLLKDKQLAVYHHEGFWSAMDTYSDVEDMNKQWKKDPLWKIWK